MKLLMFAVYDEKAESYNSPWTVSAIGMASRQFSEAINGDGMLAKYPQDFSLYHVGYFNQTTALVEPVTPPSLIGRGPDYKNKPNVTAFTERDNNVLDKK